MESRRFQPSSAWWIRCLWICIIMTRPLLHANEVQPVQVVRLAMIFTSNCNTNADQIQDRYPVLLISHLRCFQKHVECNVQLWNKNQTPHGSTSIHWAAVLLRRSFGGGERIIISYHNARAISGPMRPDAVVVRFCVSALSDGLRSDQRHGPLLMQP